MSDASTGRAMRAALSNGFVGTIMGAALLALTPMPGAPGAMAQQTGTAGEGAAAGDAESAPVDGAAGETAGDAAGETAADAPEGAAGEDGTAEDPAAEAATAGDAAPEDAAPEDAAAEDAAVEGAAAGDAAAEDAAGTPASDAPADAPAGTGTDAETAAEAETAPPAAEDAPPAEETARETSDFDSYPLPVGPFSDGPPPVRVIAGAVDRVAWRLDDPQASVASVVESYRRRLEDGGFELLYQCADEDCGGFDFRFDAEIMAPPAMQVDVRDFAQLSVWRPRPEAYISVLVSRLLDTIYVQTVTITPAGKAPVLAPPDAAAGEDALRVMREPAEPAPAAITASAQDSAPAPAPSAAPEATPQPLPQPQGTAAAPAEELSLLAALRRDGHAPVRGVEFDPGGVRVSDGSAPALDALATMLKDNAGVSVLIVGHSDNEGALAPNVELSRQRAEAVMQALVERGVAAERLEAHGAGFLAPVATNATAQGRASNRRVELVLR